MSTTDLPDEKRIITITHPFSPEKGKQLTVIERMNTWGEDRILCLDENGDSRRIPTSWTDYLPPSPFTAVSKGTVDFCYDDLIKLSQLVSDIRKKCQANNVGVSTESCQLKK